MAWPARNSARRSEDEDRWSYTAADIAFMKALSTRPQLPEGIVWEEDEVADHKLVCAWHEQAWKELAKSQSS